MVKPAMKNAEFRDGRRSHTAGDRSAHVEGQHRRRGARSAARSASREPLHRRFFMPADLQPQFIAFLIRLSVFLLVELSIYLLM
jgi:hypothetical protein